MCETQLGSTVFGFDADTTGLLTVTDLGLDTSFVTFTCSVSKSTSYSEIFAIDHSLSLD